MSGCLAHTRAPGQLRHPPPPDQEPLPRWDTHQWTRVSSQHGVLAMQPVSEHAFSHTPGCRGEVTAPLWLLGHPTPDT